MLSKLIPPMAMAMAMGAPIMHSVQDGEQFQHWLPVVLSSVLLSFMSAGFMIDGRLVWILMSLEL